MSSALAADADPGPSSAGAPGSTRDRIRDAAVLRFARSGFGTSVRTIAADAGVSPALVIHHFGSKDALHAACDEHVLAGIVESKRQNMGRATGGQLLQVLAEVDEYAPLLGYVVRSLQAGGDVARAFVEHMIEDARVYTREAVAAGIAKPSVDEDARVRYLTLSSLGTLSLALTLNPPEDPEDVGATVRTFLAEHYLPMIELYAQGFLTSRRMLDDYLLYVSDPPTGGESDDAPAPETTNEEP
ncbi:MULTISPECIES: TetR/AcrR family transcriptional regulator [unclassified Isoptericola]|uniref:TetR/AcrR family transcriptional regulator n=1 Tax=unclassified Isoptericola TaxID=2623355 RepID=UPI00271306B8|nr:MULTISPECIES: TetR family transcriptional regulator [unclassified Isoptericola]MDO8143560.1 TetR family transcriptional regulator [Isoptericola sp. 178]MDO8147426.1 TetR family transcriptional regulator [Isoptericola sp. b515]